MPRAARALLHPLNGLAAAFGAAAVMPLRELPTTAALLGLCGCALALQLLRGWRLGCLLAACIGFALAAGEGAQRMAERLDPSLEGQEIEVQGWVDGLPVRDARSLRIDLVTAAAGLPSRVRLARYEHARTPRPGDCLRAIVRLKRPRGVVNAGGFDFERHALVQRIGATGYIVRELETGDCQPGTDIDSLRLDLASAIDAALPAGRIRATVKGLAIGDTRELGDADWDLFRATGTTHLIAISGLHVGLAAALGGAFAWSLWWLWPMLALRLPRPQAMALGALGSGSAYALIAGFTLPTQRTLLTLAALLAGVLLRRELGWWTRYSLALVAVLLFDPLAPLSPGFWLSFAAVAWLILAFARGWRPQAWWRLWLLPQLGLALALLPLSLSFFQQASLAAPAVNLLAVPWVTFVVVPVLLLALLSTPVIPLASLLWKCAAWLLEPFDALIVATADWPLGRWTLPAPDAWTSLLALLATAVVLAPRGWPGRALGLAGLLPLLWPRGESLPDRSFELTLLDVGQGQAALVRTAGHTLLVDTGPGFPDGGDLGDRVLAPALAQLGVRTLDRLIVSHADLDHAGGTASLRRRLPIDDISTSLPADIEGSRACLAGERWTWDGVAFEILHPPALMPYLGNESSCVLRIHGEGGSALIPGDIGAVIEGRLVREQAARLDVDVLVAAHHGSAGSTSQDFLDAVSAREVWYSAGYRNRWHFPREEVQARVAAAGAFAWNTATAGAVSRRFELGGRSVGARRHWRRWWREPGDP